MKGGATTRSQRTHSEVAGRGEFAGGSVHWINDFVNISPAFSVWDRLMLSRDGQTIPPDAF